ncbi:SDR family NAD(P)-dependent oxidoreductase [Kutzneria kofuensis]|uniref:NAD(P)-dependent dehydrogenase (Short-subunit alcohol dehydrogenase family) n=1 Tax=Kutzneria kofuensis TaxID=103725 RepID=A0A7W9KPJ8_9PSEU|nr:SDR family NAD(P)-dependent oxidoreductase [Kutzneria kofuensis]MBB5896357.1 NAD(P)-dependent dehydrogenase (short-subunit alcohol dehydrogenase family) [Kutzneria kofuensis]
MSVAEVEKFCHRLNADPDLLALARSDLDGALSRFGLTERERQAVRTGDVGLLLADGVHPVLLVRLHVHGIAGLTEAEYSRRVRAVRDVTVDRRDEPARPYCLVTGATGGLGRELAAAFCRAGYHPVLTARDTDALDALVADLRPLGPATAIPADITDPVSVVELGERVRAVTDELAAAVANAGIALDQSFLQPREPLARWREMVLLNVFGTAATARLALPMLVPARGRLVLVGSVVGRTVVPGDLYSVTKNAVTALAAAVRAEAEPVGVGVSVVQPGLMDTAMVSPDRRSRPMLAPREVARQIVRLVVERGIQADEVVLRPVAGRDVVTESIGG